SKCKGGNTMAKKQEAYKRTEKWWLGLVILFYVLYNLPGVPNYHDARGALIHGALTIIPLWIITYVGMSVVHKQRKLKHTMEVVETVSGDNTDKNKEGAVC
ncbi:MAG: hypothetical protein Q8912_15760, partial [Bacillota bacterium]|nr:hypothetical protein [Bacillota bacterium]